MVCHGLLFRLGPVSCQIPSRTCCCQHFTARPPRVTPKGTKYRGEFEERLKKLLDEVKKSDDIILVIDEVHTLVGAGAAEGAIDAANIMKPGLARGELQVIGATTIAEYRKHIEKDAALERRSEFFSRTTRLCISGP